MKRIRYSYVKHTQHLDDINEMAVEAPRELIDYCESQYRDNIQDIADYLAAQRKKYRVIMLSGPSASGKTTTSKILSELLGGHGIKTEIISLDNFYLGRGQAPKLENGEYDYESVHALDLPLMEETLTALIKTGQCQMPIFDFPAGKPSTDKTPIALGEDDVAIVEGIHALNPLIADPLPQDRLLRMYISVKQGIRNEREEDVLTAQDIRLLRRTVRDYAFRASSVENTFTMWEQVMRGEIEYIQPYKWNADITINSVHMYEPCIMAEGIQKLLEEVTADSRFYEKAQRLLGALEQFHPIPQAMVPENSLLKEFIGGGIYWS